MDQSTAFSTAMFGPSNAYQAQQLEPSTLISDEFLRNLRQKIRQEFRNEISQRTTIVNDCLVCNNSPSPDCPICKGKYQLSLRKFNENAAKDTLAAKAGKLTGFSESFTRNPRLPISALSMSSFTNENHSPVPPPPPPLHHNDQSNFSMSSSARPSPRGQSPSTTRRSGSPTRQSLSRSHFLQSQLKKSGTNTMGELHEQILDLRRQVLRNEEEIKNLNGSLDDATTNTFYWKQQCQVANAKATAMETKLAVAEDRIRELEDKVDELKESNAQLLERTRVSEACRTNSARVIAKMRKEMSGAPV